MAKSKGKPAKAPAKQPVASKQRVMREPDPIERDVVEPGGEWGFAMHLSWWSLLLMVFITPLAIANLRFLGFDLPISYDQFDIVKVFCQRVLTLISLSFWAWEVFIRGGRIRFTPVEILVAAFLVWTTISTIVSIHPETAFFGKYRRFEGLASFFNYATMYFLVLQMADGPKRLRQLANTFFATGFLVAFYGVLQYLGKDFLEWGQLPFEVNRAFSTYGNPDLLGGFLMFSFFVSLGLAFSQRNTWIRGIYWLGVLVNAACIIVAFTRSAWVGSFVGLIAFGIIAWRQRMRWVSEDWVFSGAALAAAVWPAIKSMSPDNPNAVMNFGLRVKSIFEFGEGSAKTRFEIWEAAWRGIKARPIFGFGPDTFRLVFPTYKPVEYVADAGYLSVADNVHNYPLQLAVGVGVPGWAMLYGIFGWVAVRTGRIVFSRDGGMNRALLGGIWAACAAYVAHLLFGLSVTGSTFLMWVFMAALLSPTARSVRLRPQVWGVIVALAISGFAVWGIAAQFQDMKADQAYLRARVFYQRGSQERVEAAREAVRLNPNNDMYRAEVGLALLEQVDGAQGDAQRRAAVLAAEESLLDTIKFVPAEYDNYVFLASLYNSAGAYTGDPTYYEKAADIAERGIEIEKYGPAIRLQYASALYSLGDNEESFKQLEIAHKMDPAYMELTWQLADMYEKEGRIEDAMKVYKRSAEFNDRPFFIAQYGRLLNQLGEGDKAIEVFEKGVKLNGYAAELVTVYSDVLVSRGMRDEALAVLNKALETNPGNTDMQQRIQTIQSGAATATPAQ